MRLAFVKLLPLMQSGVRPEMLGRASGLVLTALFGAGSITGHLMGALVAVFGRGGAALIELTLLSVVGILAMALGNPSRLVPVAKIA